MDLLRDVLHFGLNLTIGDDDADIFDGGETSKTDDEPDDEPDGEPDDEPDDVENIEVPDFF